MTATPHNATWRQVRSWRLRQNLLTRRGHRPDAFSGIADRICGVQAQVQSAAKLAIWTRSAKPETGDIDLAISERRLLRIWAMRGTLHLLTPRMASAFLSLLTRTRSWETRDWQRKFLTAPEMELLASAVERTLRSRVLTRAELAEEVLSLTGSPVIAEQLRSRWGDVLKPLSWQGLLCHGPARGRETTFTSPLKKGDDWKNLDEVEAARIAIPAYLAVHGPATPAAFDAWLTGGTTPRAILDNWFRMTEDLLDSIYVEDQPLLARTNDIECIREARPTSIVRLLPAFDQFVLGPGSGDPHTVPPEYRRRISRTAGWISPTVVTSAGVIGIWDISKSTLSIQLFADTSPSVKQKLLVEAERVWAFYNRSFSVKITIG